MKPGFFLEYPWWFTLFCLLAAALYAGVLYWREKTFTRAAGHPRWLHPLLTGLRAVVVFLLAFLLLSPYVKRRSTEEFKPIVALITDNSESMHTALKSDSSKLLQTMQDIGSKLSAKYEVVHYNLSDELTQTQETVFNGKATALSEGFSRINDLYYNRNLGAVVLASDGIYNKGIHPVYATQNAAYRIFTIAVGDTTLPRDLSISNVLYNKTVFLNDRLGVKLDVEASNLQGSNATLKVFRIEEGGSTSELPLSKTFNIAQQQTVQSFEFELPADKTGVLHYRFSLSPLNGEVTYRNNSRDIYFEVLDMRQKILLLAHSPHPDLAAIKAAIENNKNYSAEIAYAAEFNASVADYSLIVLHQLPSAVHKVQGILKQVRELKKPMLFILGSQTSLTDFRQAQNLVILNAGGDKFNDVSAANNKNFSLFTISDRLPATLGKLAPLSALFGEYKTNPAAQVLLFQKINSVETDFPLLCFSENDEQKLGVITAEGFWRWRLYDFMQNKNFDATNELMNKTIQYLAVKTDKRPFIVSLPKTIFSDNEKVVMEARLLNPSLEPVNTPDVDVTIRSEDRKEYTYSMERSEKNYRLDAGFFPGGNYTYSASAKLGNQTYTFSGKFTISPLQLEELRTRADHNVLFQLADRHRGSMHTPADAASIADKLLNDPDMKTVLYDKFSTDSVMRFKWIFFLLLLLVSSEWFLRKYHGGY